ncbi:MAG: hypothetical protein KF869_11690 [Phycisphaeraceae bacterium]|nr:hypothetical protein [Phycisphaeraceae bacterium]
MSGQFNIGPSKGPRFPRGDDAASESAAADHAADFDALTDLFMGEVNAPPPRPDVHPPVRRAPVLRLASEEDLSDWDDDADSPDAAAGAPAAIAPLPPSPPRIAATAARGRDTARGDGTPARPSAEPAIVECIVLGNLPVYGAAWAAQYVREVARAAGRPVAYLRLQSGYASVELVGGGESAAIQAFASLEDAVKHAAARTYRWVLRADLGEEPRVAASPMVRVVTLLTGVDETAVLGAYTSIKSLASELSADGDTRDVAIRVAVMGATPMQAEPACKRLADAARQFLGRDVQYAVCGAKVSASRPADVLFSGRTEMRTADVMALLSQTLAAPGQEAAIPEMPSTPTPAVEPAAAGSLDELIERLAPVEPDTLLDDVYEDEPAPAPAARVPDPMATDRKPVPRSPVPPPMVPAVAAAATVAPVRAPEPVARAGACTEPEPVGALALLLEGLRPVSVLCPYAPGVELALDPAGGLHLLVRTEPEDGEDSEQRALSQLLVAGAWAEAHAMLLGPALAQAGAPAAFARPMHEAHKPALHLFTDRPKRSRRLLETDVRIHLLARVNIGGQSGWYCTELN